MRKLSVSVAMTAYNNSEYLKLLLESLIGQTIYPDELIICEDCSQETEVRSILESFKKAYKGNCTVYYNKENLGSLRNYEKAFSLCKGDIIFQCDSDDIWEPTKVEDVITCFLENPNCSLVFHDSTVIDGKGNEICGSFVKWKEMNVEQLNRENYLYNVIAKHMYPYGMSIAVRKEVIKNAIPFRLVEDQWIAMCAPFFGEIQYIDKKLSKYRRHNKNESGKNKQFEADSKRKMIYKTIISRKDTSLEQWYDWADRTIKDFEVYKNMFCEELSQRVNVQLEELIFYGYAIRKICHSRGISSVIELFILYKYGIYQKFRGNRNQFILDLIFTI